MEFTDVMDCVNRVTLSSKLSLTGSWEVSPMILSRSLAMSDSTKQSNRPERQVLSGWMPLLRRSLMSSLVSLLSYLHPIFTHFIHFIHQLASWIMLLVSFPLAAWVISTIKDTTYTEEKTVYVDELKNGELDSNERVD